MSNLGDLLVLKEVVYFLPPYAASINRVTSSLVGHFSFCPHPLL